MQYYGPLPGLLPWWKMAALGRQKPRPCSSETQGSNGGRTATFALSKELQRGGGKGAEGSFENLLSNQSKRLAKNLWVKLTDAWKKDDHVERILGMYCLDAVRNAAGTEDDDSAEVWCSETGSLTSLNACNSGASSDVREPISLHQAVHRRSSEAQKLKICLCEKGLGGICENCTLAKICAFTVNETTVNSLQKCLRSQ